MKKLKIGDSVKIIRYGFITNVERIEKSHFIDDKDVYVLKNGANCHIEEITKV